MLLPAVIEAKLHQILQPLTAPRAVTQPPLNVKPKLNFSTHPSAKQMLSESSPDQPMTLANQRSYGSESNLLDSVSSAAHDTGVGGNVSRTGMRTAGSVPDLLSPQHVERYGEEPPPLPPERPVASSDMPDASVAQYYDTPGSSDTFYNTPPVKYPHHSDTPDLYNVPPTTYPAERGNNFDGACYDVPPTDETGKLAAKKARKKQSEAKVCEVSGGDVYNVPPVHNAADRWISTGSTGGEFYENVLSGSGKKSREGRDVGRAGSLENQKSSSQATSVCFTDQTYDSPSAEHWGRKLQSHGASLSASSTDETYDTPSRNEIKEKKIQPQKLSDKHKQSIDFQPSTVSSDQTYDTPPTSDSLAKTHPVKPHRGKLRSSLESAEAARHFEQFSGQETYDIPPTAQRPSSTVKPPVAARSYRQTALPTDELYDVPPPKSAAGHSSSNRVSLSGAADLTGLSQPAMAEEQTYNVPPVPAKRNPAPPPKPPRPTVTISTQNAVSAADSSVLSVEESVKAVCDENELTEQDTVAELPGAAVKGISLTYSDFFKLSNISIVNSNNSCSVYESHAGIVIRSVKIMSSFLCVCLCLCKHSVVYIGM